MTINENAIEESNEKVELCNMDNIYSPLSISEVLGDFLDNCEYPQRTITDLVPGLLRNCEKWYNEKFEIFFTIKSFFASYQKKVSMMADAQMIFQDYYDKKIQPSLRNFFDEALNNKTISSKKKNNVKKIETFVFQCFDSFTSEEIYDQMNLQASYSQRLFSEMKRLKNDQYILSESIKTSKKQIKKTKEEMNQATQKVTQKATKKATESGMTVLGIFVGVVMVFFGGFTILENAIEAMTTASPYRLIFTMLIFGIILFNIVVLLFYLIGKLTQKRITCECTDFILPPDSEKTQQKCAKCNKRKYLTGICHARHSFPYVYWGNSIILTLLVFVFCMYAFKSIDGILISNTFPVIFLKYRDINSLGITVPQTILSFVCAGISLTGCILLAKTKKTKADN